MVTTTEETKPAERKLPAPAAAAPVSSMVDESAGRSLSYYEHDLVVVDWDAALLIDERRNFAA